MSSPLLLWTTLTITPSAHGFFHNTALSVLLQRPTRACPGIQRPATVVSENIQGRRSLLTTTSWIQCGQSYCAAHPDPMVPTACICSLSVNRMEALGTTGLMAWRQPLQSQSCQIKILFHGLLTIHVHNYNISILWHHNFCCNFSARCMLQAPVIVVDQPMYSLPKKLQWNFPVTHGEDKYVVFLGGMHVKLTVDKCLGNWLEGSGWTTVVTTNSGIASGGTADSFLKTSHLGSTKHVFQLTAAVLYMDHAYLPYEGRALDDEVVDFTIWKKKLSDEPQFAYWCWS